MKNLPFEMGTLLRLAIFGCFVGHGTIAIQNSNIFYSEWNYWAQQLFPDEQKYIGAQFMLSTVGAIDILVGLWFLLPAIPFYALAWAITWGALTATSRLYFLSGIIPGFWTNVVYPLSEFLVRTPNWIVPIVFYAFYFNKTHNSLFNRVSEMVWIRIAVATQVIGLFLHYLVELNNQIYPIEILKKGMPIWYFHLGGVAAMASILAFVLSLNPSLRSRLAKVAGLLAITAYMLVEGFGFALNTHHGFTFTTLRVLEHAPIYLCLAYSAINAVRNSRPQAS